MTDNRQKLIARLNRGPLGKLVLESLVTLQVEPDPTVLNLVQLIEATVEGDREKLPPLVREHRERLADLMPAAAEGPPEEILARAVNRNPEVSLEVEATRLAKRLRGKTPQEIGATLAENLLLSLVEEDPEMFGATRE